MVAIVKHVSGKSSAHKNWFALRNSGRYDTSNSGLGDVALKAQVFAWRERGFAYLVIPKAACTSIKWTLFQARGLPLPENWWHIHKATWPEQMEFSDVRSSGLDVISVVRHPVRRLTSLFCSKMNPDEIGDLSEDHPEIRLGMSFGDFVDFVCRTPDSLCSDHIASQSFLLSDERGIIPQSSIRMERLQAAWPVISSAYKLPPLPMLNQQGSRTDEAGKRIPSVQAHPTTSQADRLLSRYRNDMKAFGF